MQLDCYVASASKYTFLNKNKSTRVVLVDSILHEFVKDCN